MAAVCSGAEIATGWALPWGLHLPSWSWCHRVPHSCLWELHKGLTHPILPGSWPQVTTLSLFPQGSCPAVFLSPGGPVWGRSSPRGPLQQEENIPSLEQGGQFLGEGWGSQSGSASCDPCSPLFCSLLGFALGHFLSLSSPACDPLPMPALPNLNVCAHPPGSPPSILTSTAQ